MYAAGYEEGVMAELDGSQTTSSSPGLPLAAQPAQPVQPAQNEAQVHGGPNQEAVLEVEATEHLLQMLQPPRSWRRG